MSVTMQNTIQGIIEVTVNGERRGVVATRVDALLRELDYEGAHYAVAVNYDVIPRSRWSEAPIKSGDEIEILTPRQGG